MTKKELSQYRSICAEIVEIEARLRDNMLHDSVSGSDAEFPYTQHTMSIAGLEDNCDNSRDLLKLDRLRRRKRRIEDFVDDIPDSETRRIFRYRYISGKRRMSWQRIAFKIGHHDESYPRRVHKNYLEKIIDKKN